MRRGGLNRETGWFDDDFGMRPVGWEGNRIRRWAVLDRRLGRGEGESDDWTMAEGEEVIVEKQYKSCNEGTNTDPL
jgi:hypothetical protein